MYRHSFHEQKKLQLVLFRQLLQPTRSLWETWLGFSVNKESSEPETLCHIPEIKLASSSRQRERNKTSKSLLHHIHITHK